MSTIFRMNGPLTIGTLTWYPFVLFHSLKRPIEGERMAGVFLFRSGDSNDVKCDQHLVKHVTELG